MFGLPASWRCSQCAINYPKTRKCQSCGEPTQICADPPDEDWEEKVKILTVEMPHALDEEMKVVTWRAKELVGAGYPAQEALALAKDRHVDLHQACNLLKNGCPFELALEILL